jgi:hypothetical protein
LDELVTVSFDIESREFNGRWFTSIRAWKVQQGIVDANAAPAPAAAPQPAAQPAAAAEPMMSNTNPFDAPAASSDDLPF